MKFKTELHCHSHTVSACGRITPEQIVEKYLSAGYTTVVLTEHLSPATLSPKNYHGADNWYEKINFFLSGYRALSKAAAGRLNILLGAEFRLNKHEAADFLAYGVTEEFLRTYPDILETGFTEFSGRVRNAGLLLYQAHPFRNKMIVTDPSLLDGIEIYNGNPRADSRNDMAEIWAKRFGLATIAGSDVHRAEDPAVAGILTDAPVTDNRKLLTVLKTNAYTLIPEHPLKENNI